MPFYHIRPNNDSSTQLTQLTEMVPFASRPRAHYYYMSADKHEAKSFKEFYLAGDGKCALYGLGVAPKDVFPLLKEKIKTNPLIKNMVYQDMRESFLDYSDKNPVTTTCRRFHFNAQSSLEYYGAYLLYTKKTLAEAEQMLKEFCENKMEAYLDAYQEGLEKNEPWWYLFNPHPPAHGQDESDTYRLITAIAECYNLKLTTFSRHYFHQEFRVTSGLNPSDKQEQNILYLWKNKVSVSYAVYLHGKKITGNLSETQLKIDNKSFFNDIIVGKPLAPEHKEIGRAHV